MGPRDDLMIARAISGGRIIWQNRKLPPALITRRISNELVKNMRIAIVVEMRCNAPLNRRASCWEDFENRKFSHPHSQCFPCMVRESIEAGVRKTCEAFDGTSKTPKKASVSGMGEIVFAARERFVITEVLIANIPFQDVPKSRMTHDPQEKETSKERFVRSEMV